MSSEMSEEKPPAAARRPVWKHRIAFQKNRNVSIVLWPPGAYEGHPTPPAVTFEEGAYDSERKSWLNTRINITLDKLPNVIQDLQIAYAKALEFGLEPAAEAEAEEHSIPYLKDVLRRVMKEGTVYTPKEIVRLVKAEAPWGTEDDVGDAIRQLEKGGEVVPAYRGLDFSGYRRVKGTSPPTPAGEVEAPRTVGRVQDLFPRDFEEMLEFEETGEFIIIRPRRYLGSENFAKIASIVRDAGGEYLSAGKESHFRVPRKTA